MAPETDALSGRETLQARTSSGRLPGPPWTPDRGRAALRERFREAPVGFERIAEFLVAGRVMGARHQQRVTLARLAVSVVLQQAEPDLLVVRIVAFLHRSQRQRLDQRAAIVAGGEIR